MTVQILIDMDGTIADFEGYLFQQYAELYPTQPLPDAINTGFYVAKRYPEPYSQRLWEIITAPNFFRSLPPIDGALEAIAALEARGHTLFLCTSPLLVYENCVLEKFQWVDEHLGKSWIPRMILATDKTVVTGDIIIDDKPKISGANPTPTWEHIFYDQVYNRDVSNQRRLTWATWQDVITD